MRRKVAIYARVSTEHEAQISALNNQVQYYDNILAMHPEWELVERYIDEGITGTSVKKRKNFVRMMADWIFRTISVDKENVIELASQMISQHLEEDEKDYKGEITELKNVISRERNRLNNLIEMRMDGEIEKEVFLEKKERIDKKILNLENKLCEYELLENTKCDSIEEQLKSLQAIMKNEWNFSRQEIPEEVVDAFVDSIIVYQDHFEWNLKLTDEKIRCKVDGTKRKGEVSLVENPLFVGCNTGCFE